MSAAPSRPPGPTRAAAASPARFAAAWRALALGAVALLLVAAAGVAPVEELARARGPEREWASEFWTLAARLDSGDFVFAEIGITNVGMGDGNAVVSGHLVRTDGEILEFKKAKRAGKWELSADGLRLAVGPVVLDLRGPRHRFRVDHEQVRVDLTFDAQGPASAPSALAGADHGFALLSSAAPAEAAIWTRSSGRAASTRGRVALTHRWAERLEARLVVRRIEFFSAEGDARLYLVEALDTAGEARRWVRLERHGRILVDQAAEWTLEWCPGVRTGFPLPEALRLESGALSGRIDLGPVLIRYDPLRDLSLPVRLGLAPLMRSRIAWSGSTFDVRWNRGAARPVRISGAGVANVTYFNPHPPVQASRSGPTSGEGSCASES